MTIVTSWLDWKLGWRMLLKYPGLSVIGGLTLALAIGVGAGWFEVTRQILNPRLPLADGDRIVRIETWDAAASQLETRSVYDFELWRKQLTSVTELGAYRTLERNLILAEGTVYPARVAEISPVAFPLTRVPPLLGRPLSETDAEPGAMAVVVIGYEVWQDVFGGGPILGRTIKVGRTQPIVVGVMPEGFGFPVNHQAWTPLRRMTAPPREGPRIQVFGRLAQGATLVSAQTELTAIGQRIASQNPATHAQLRARVIPYAAPAPGSADATLLRLSNIIGWLILAAACANVATLLFARTATREAEIVVRNALGASRARVLMQLLVEALVLSTVAAIVGLTAASFGIEHVVRLFIESENSTALPFWWEFGIRPATIAYTAALAIGGAALIALLPALKATGTRVQSALSTAASGGTSIRFGRTWSSLIILQVATAALCLPLGVFAFKWTFNDQEWRSVFPTQEYLTFRPELDRDVALAQTGQVSEAEHRAQLLEVYRQLKNRLEAEPAVAAVTFGTGFPGMYHPLRQLEAQHGSDPPILVDAMIEGDRVRTSSVDVTYFEALQVPLVAGRAFHGGDVAARDAVIINQTLARSIGANPLGVRIRFLADAASAREGQQARRWYEVVGIVRDTGPAGDHIFLPTSAANVSPLHVAIHLRGAGGALARRLPALAAQVDPGLRLYEVLPLDELVRRRQLPEIQGAFAVGGITLLLMVLSAASLYSLVSVSVARRTREIGIRLAIGANPGAVLAALFARAATQVGIGIVIALVLLPTLLSTVGISELPASLVAQTMLIASGGMLLVGLLACGVPARRALGIQPTEAVKNAG